MTLSLVAHDHGAFGIVISSSSPAVASRCAYLRPGAGAVATQNVTNPALGPVALDALEGGATAAEALAAALATEHHPDYRQVTIVDSEGRVAVHSGAQALGIHGESVGDGCVAAGNLLDNDGVLDAMVAGFETAEGSLEVRLIAALEAAYRAGGEAGQLRSAGLAVVQGVSWRVTDLRVDDHDDPVSELARLLDLWLPQKDDYLTRALSPTAAPSYGVPGDE
ncbi:DUF1028 domain-containing protein [Microbacterium memoriense]|uniref:DUF1028 domain-containing protein n=1 Tax=Microbacterium memoriense TaxID=2978350 RepID=A0ABT2P9C1_9MICO|nr:DUF1028 domain-containing protein [Microbacterium memoriense]MCT9001059.1 DUF1028 domain-containing protein [Microbacterium memoriense]